MKNVPFCVCYTFPHFHPRDGERASYKGLRLMLDVLSRHHALREATDGISLYILNTIDSLTTAHNSGLRKVSGKYNLNSSRNDIIGVEASINWLNVYFFKSQNK